ncbi:MAG: hypothetical protein KDA69_12475 [Planctomycetaceae bacterium]|nr:hypothetical protein [Planctomycetaceae bacterium]
MQRWYVALIAALLLSGAYQAYSYLLLPLVATHGEAVAPPLEGATEFHPPVFKEVANDHFADFPWTSNAAIKWQRGENTFLFAETAEPDESGDGRVVKFAPLALLWSDPEKPDAAPYRIVAQSGRIQFENAFFDEAFDLTQVNPGRIIGASLDGAVLINGPDALMVQGRDFVFSETNAELTSYNAIKFVQGPAGDKASRIRGSADGINVLFIPTTDPVLGKDLPRVAGIQSLKLRQNVRLEFDSIEKGGPSNVLVTSRGPFQYDFPSRQATFEEDVRVTQTKRDKSGKSMADRLVCHALGLLFEPDPTRQDEKKPKPDASSESQSLSELRTLRLRKVHALGLPENKTQSGSKVILESQSQQILGNLSDLRYDPVERIAELRDGQQVIVQRGDTRFGSPTIQLVHDAENHLVSLTCTGAGQLAHQIGKEEEDDKPVTAQWERQLTVHPQDAEGLQVVKLNGEVRLNMPDSLAVAADAATLWLTLDEIEKLENRSTNDKENLLRQPLPIRRAEARGNVFVVGSELIVGRLGQRREGGAKELIVNIQPGKLPLDQSGGVLRTGAESESKKRPPLFVEADKLQVMVHHDMAQGRMGVQQIEGEGSVRLEQLSSETIQVGDLRTERNLAVTGVGFVAQNEGNDRQVVTLYGNASPNGDITEPAKVELGPFSVAGGILTLNRIQNVASVDGPGRLTFPVPIGLAGEKLNHPADMMIVWRERMVFDGKTVTFHGAVQGSILNDKDNISRIECEEMVVRLQNRVDFQRSPNSGQKAELDSIECKHNVKLDMFAYEDTRLVGRRHAQLVSFWMNRQSDQFGGEGPGKIDLWTYGEPVELAQQSGPVANRPAKRKEDSWRHTNIIFRGSMTGSSEREYMELSDDVEIVSAPVTKHSETFQRHGLSNMTEQAANAAWIGCDKLHVSYPANEKTKSRAAVILATGSTQLEAQQFHASADEIRFEEFQGRFTLRGHGRDALLHSQKVPGQPWDTTSNRLVEFTPSIPRISVDGSSGIRGGL